MDTHVITLLVDKNGKTLYNIFLWFGNETFCHLFLVNDHCDTIHLSPTTSPKFYNPHKID
jgi:hypothetical protein